jgi:hypothetical protein
MVRVRFSAAAMPCDDNLTSVYPKELVDLLVVDPDVVEIVDNETGEVILSR